MKQLQIGVRLPMAVLASILTVALGAIFAPATVSAAEAMPGIRHVEIPGINPGFPDTLTPVTTEPESHIPGDPDPGEGESETSQLYLPMASFLRPISTRLGFASTQNSLTKYPGVDSLRAGWYVNWSVTVDPVRPNGMEFVQMVRLHQKLACEIGSANAADRQLCPHVENEYLVTPEPADIEAAAKAHPGSVWLLGNEMDRRDFCANAECTTTAGQDEMLPETYAIAYHELYTLIKSADPTARVAIGGVIQATPLRLKYLSRIWEHYKTLYGTEMPVDIWNIHAFVLREERNGYGADIPPGLDDLQGEYTQSDCSHLGRDAFDNQIRAMRQWMKERGQQNKPLIVTEYGVLYNAIYSGAPCADESLDAANEQSVIDYMVWTFDYFLKTKDTEIGFPEDDYRLVQAWNWYSMDHLWTDQQGNVLPGLNPYASLYNSTFLSLTKTGEAFRQYSLDNLIELNKPYPKGD